MNAVPAPCIFTPTNASDVCMTYHKLRRIGAGFCGTVWTSSSSEKASAFKREDGGPDRSLENDYHMHQRILNSVRQLAHYKDSDILVNIPICHAFIRPTDEDWWANNLDGFPAGYSPCNMVHVQRIPPFEEDTRKYLIDRYCPPEIKSSILASDTNKDCLVRPYLGRRRIKQARERGFKAFSLRNYPLHLDQMEELKIPEEDICDYARAMADALAILHWVGEVDGNDIEFVLAPPTSDSDNKKVWNNCLRKHVVWMLDFDLVRDMAVDENGIQQAVAACRKNDPFYPRPGSGTIWKAFRDRYLQTSRDCILSLGTAEGFNRPSLPELFIQCLEN